MYNIPRPEGMCKYLPPLPPHQTAINLLLSLGRKDERTSPAIPKPIDRPWRSPDSSRSNRTACVPLTSRLLDRRSLTQPTDDDWKSWAKAWRAHYDSTAPIHCPPPAVANGKPTFPPPGASDLEWSKWARATNAYYTKHRELLAQAENELKTVEP